MTRWYAVYWPPYALVPVRATKVSDTNVLGNVVRERWLLHVFGVRLAVWTAP